MHGSYFARSNNKNDGTTGFWFGGLWERIITAFSYERWRSLVHRETFFVWAIPIVSCRAGFRVATTRYQSYVNIHDATLV